MMARVAAWSGAIIVGGILAIEFVLPYLEQLAAWLTT